MIKSKSRFGLNHDRITCGDSITRKFDLKPGDFIWI